MTIAGLIKYERCEYWLYNCPFTNSTGECVNQFCTGQPYGFGSCSEDFPNAGACCTKPDPAGCLYNFQHNLGPDNDGPCATVRSELAKCESMTGFVTMAPQNQASCLCYNNIGNYVPSIWDNAATSCWASGSSAHPFLFSLLTASNSEALGFCTNYAGPGVASATTTESQTVTTRASGSTTSSSAAAATSTVAPSTTTSAVSTSTTTSFTTAPAPAPSSTTSSSSSTTATASASSGTQQVTPVDKKMLILGLFLVMPVLLMAAI